MSNRAWLSALLACVALAACSLDPDDGTEARRRPRVDAPVADAPAVRLDAAPSTGGTPSVSCYRQNAPSASCTGTACCFDNYSAQHNGACGTSCAWGTIRCDGPEDCTGGQHCCAHASADPDWGLTGYQLACQASACGAPPFDQELCHSDADCSGGRHCVSAYGYDNDLPRTLSVCK